MDEAGRRFGKEIRAVEIYPVKIFCAVHTVGDMRSSLGSSVQYVGFFRGVLLSDLHQGVHILMNSWDKKMLCVPHIKSPDQR